MCRYTLRSSTCEKFSKNTGERIFLSYKEYAFSETSINFLSNHTNDFPV